MICPSSEDEADLDSTANVSFCSSDDELFLNFLLGDPSNSLKVNSLSFDGEMDDPFPRPRSRCKSCSLGSLKDVIG